MTADGEQCVSRPEIQLAAAVAVGDTWQVGSSESGRIDTWVAEQVREPWPLNSVQLDLIRRILCT
jgi:hypothetical protein